MAKKEFEKLYSDEISLLTLPEHAEYVRLNLQKISELRRNFDLPMVGIAGADGKSTTKGMLSAILSQRGPLLETPLDCDSTSVVSSTLLKLTKEMKFGLIELGIIHPQQFKLAVALVQPTVGLITNIGEAKLARQGEQYLITDAKVELMRQLKGENFAILNIDDELVSGMETFTSTQRVIKFGFNNAAHFFATEINYRGPEGIEFTVNNYYRFSLAAYGSTAVSNALAAIATARVLNFDFEEIQRGLKEKFQLIPGRGNLIDLKEIFILDHTYNATINSVPKACESLVQFKKFSQNLILVLGGVEGLGAVSRDVHINFGYYISALPIDCVITVGTEAQPVGEGLRRINHTRKVIAHCETPSTLPETLLNKISPHTTILMMGGKSLHLSRQLQNLVQRLK